MTQSLFNAYMKRVTVPTRPDNLSAYQPEFPDAPFVWIRLSDGQLQAARQAARDELAKRDIVIDNRTHISHAEELEIAVQWQVLARAMRDPKRKGQRPNDPYPHRLAHAVGDLREHLTADARVALVQSYADWIRDLMPASPARSSRDELAHHLNAIRAGHCAQWSPAQLRNFAESVVDFVVIPEDE
ncbi:MAG: hypothetical protein AAGC55_02370 [Myxococcota bacterium]